jgi:hypothetical protein
MSDLCKLIWCALIGLFRPRAALEAEILVLRHQLNVLRRKSPKRLACGNVDCLSVCGALSCGSCSIGCTENSQAAHSDPLAPRWFPSLLALEVTTARWPAKDAGGHSPAHSGHEHREPALGSSADPRRTAQAWHRCPNPPMRSVMLRLSLLKPRFERIDSGNARSVVGRGGTRPELRIRSSNGNSLCGRNSAGSRESV